MGSELQWEDGIKGKSMLIRLVALVEVETGRDGEAVCVERVVALAG